jgi:signal peptidase II
MKRPLLFAAALTALDQAVKLAISHFALHASVILIPGVLFFQPVQNTNLNWVASMAGGRNRLLVH